MGKSNTLYIDSYKEYIFPVIIFICIALGILTYTPVIFLIPFLVLFGWLTIERLHWIYFILIASIPFSIEMDLPGGFATDFPDEPLMWYLFGIGFILLVSKKKSFKSLLNHPLSWIICIHWLWILFTSFSGHSFFISFKYWLSKSWYLMVFYVLGYLFLKNEKRWNLFALISIVAAASTVWWIEYKHAASAFAFADINKAVMPFYRNHVNYACLLVCLFPFIYPLWHSFKHPLVKKGILFLAISLLAGIFFSYTRAAYISLFAIAILYPIIRYRWVRISFVLAIIVVIAGMSFYVYQNRYLDLAPEYTQAITHTEFGNLLSATTKGKDISTMERLYRWVAGIRMTADHYVVGFGPANFNNTYEPYTLNQFATYVSRNDERSTIHNYYLMIAVEQGIPGLVIFLALIYVFFKTAERTFHQLTGIHKKWLISTIWSVGAILMILCFNDMIETDKVGSYFFINIAILVRLSETTRP